MKSKNSILTGKTVKTKFLCKIDVSRSSGDLEWIPIFTKGNWYDGEYKVANENFVRLNGGHLNYKVINELGEITDISRAQIKMQFDLSMEHRDFKINEILGDEEKSDNK
jgi:hypothetical protein